jgi:micrococcal nuclease
MSKVRKSRRTFGIIILGLVILLIVATQSGWLSRGAKLAEINQPGLYPVASFIDGDTIAVNMNGNVETVRFIGVDTPETHKPKTPVQCYGPDAAAYTKATIGNQRVRLQADPLDTNRDRYGRLLRYIYLPSGTLLDEQLIQRGYGFAYLGFPFEKSSQFAADQAAAQASRAGLWGTCHPEVNKYGGYTSNPL